MCGHRELRSGCPVCAKCARAEASREGRCGSDHLKTCAGRARRLDAPLRILVTRCTLAPRPVVWSRGINERTLMLSAGVCAYLPIVTHINSPHPTRTPPHAPAHAVDTQARLSAGARRLLGYLRTVSADMQQLSDTQSAYLHIVTHTNSPHPTPLHTQQTRSGCRVCVSEDAPDLAGEVRAVPPADGARREGLGEPNVRARRRTARLRKCNPTCAHFLHLKTVITARGTQNRQP